MSQRGPAPGPASHRSSQSPAAREPSSSPPPPRPPASAPAPAPAPAPGPSLSQNRPSRGHDPTDPRRDDGPAPAMGGDGRFQRSAPRTSGVHNILNPSGALEPSPQAPSTLPRPPPDAESLLKMEPSPYGETGLGPRAPPLQPPSLDPAHATATSLYTPLAPARRILTPRSPRASAATRASTRLLETQPLQRPTPVPLGSGMPRELSPIGGSSMRGPRVGQAPFSAPIPGPGPVPVPPLTRSISRPASRQGYGLPAAGQGPRASVPTPRDGRASLLTTSPDASANPPPPPPLPQTRPQGGLQGGPFRTLGQDPSGVWSSGAMGVRVPGNPMAAMQTMGRGIPTPEGQHLISFMPPHGEEILVPVDVHQASKQADEKRQRNARASARFRLRKKEREEEQQVGLQRMESVTRELERRNQELEGRVTELEAERDFYRGERNRLRDIVARTPGISELADRGQPSPKSARTGGSTATAAAAESSSEHGGKRPLEQTQHHAQSSTHPYPAAGQGQTYHPLSSSYMSSSDPSIIGRPAQRRRTDPEPLFSTPVYAPGPRSTSPLPPIIAMPTSPRAPPSATENLAASSPESARLPPLRFDQASPTPSLDRGTSAPGGASAPPHPVPQAQQPATTQAPQYPPYQRSTTYEMGWATGPRDRGPGPGPREGDPR